MEVERLASSEYVPKKDLLYVDSRGTLELFSKLAFVSNLILVGPKGVGKSLSVAAFAHKHAHSVITFDCSEDVRRAQLLGMFILRGEETPFILGPLTSAIEVANETGSCVLILEEINALTPQCQKILNGLCDWRRALEVPEAKRVFRLNEGAKLWVVGTMNHSAYGGVYQLNEDLKSRFRMLPVNYPTPSEETSILQAAVPSASLDHIRSLLTLAKETRQKTMGYALSTRDLVQVLEDAQRVGIDKALLLMSGKYEEENRAGLSKRVGSTFGIDLDRVARK